jgi:hypothetical protein
MSSFLLCSIPIDPFIKILTLVFNHNLIHPNIIDKDHFAFL